MAATIKKSGNGYSVSDRCNCLYLSAAELKQFSVDLNAHFNKIEEQNKIHSDKITDKCNKLMNMDIYEFGTFVFGNGRKENPIAKYANILSLRRVAQLVHDKNLDIFVCFTDSDIRKIEECLYILSSGYVSLNGINNGSMFLCSKDLLNVRLENVLDHNTFQKLMGLKCSTFYDIVALAPYDIINHYGVGKKTIDRLLHAISNLICIHVSISSDKNCPCWELN